MQLRLATSPYHRLPQRPEAVEGVASRARAADEEHLRQQTAQPTEPPRIPLNNPQDNARRDYYYSRVEDVVGRTAQALKSYTDVEDGSGREQLQEQLGLDIYA